MQKTEMSAIRVSRSQMYVQGGWTYRIPGCLAGQEELRARDVADAIGNEQSGAGDGPLGETADIGADETQRKGNIGRKDARQTQPGHPRTSAFAFVYHDHTHHRGEGVGYHEHQPD
jgi:hypothetical protein